MRIYVSASNDRWWAIAAEVPGTASEDVPTREEAITRCRQYAAEEVEAFRRLGSPLQVSAEEDVLDWKLPWWLIPDWLVPVRPALRAAALRRMDEIATEVDALLDGLAGDEWDRRPEGGWSVRRVLDHVAGGFEIGLRRLERWPLDPSVTQTAALEELITRLRSVGGAPFAVEHSGMNQEEGRVRWTPRKVLRAARHLQEEAVAHYGAEGPPPSPMRGHGDAPDDDEPIGEADLRALVDGDAELQRLAATDRRARVIAIWYRYYRDRLNEWPTDVSERWRVMRAAFTQRIGSLDETELALVRMVPNGQCGTVRMELDLGLSHMREHLAQMGKARAATAATT